MLGSTISDDLVRETSSETYFDFANKVAEEIFEKYPNAKYIANTFRFMDNAQHNLFYATYHTKAGNYISKIYETQEVIDRIGSGDAFMGGLIAGVCKNYSDQETIELATEVGYKKLFVLGDFINL